jgi:hypothetical protein
MIMTVENETDVGRDPGSMHHHQESGFSKIAFIEILTDHRLI